VNSGIVRFGRWLVLLLVWGCSVAPATPQLQSSSPVEGVTATAVAAAAPATTPVVERIPAPTPEAAAEQSSVAPNPAPAAAEARQAAGPDMPKSEAAEAPPGPAQAEAPQTAAAAAPAGPAAGVIGDDGTLPGTAPRSADPACDGTLRLDPLPAPGSPRAQDFFRSFREPLAPAPLYDPPGPKRVGLQAGHWLTDQVPLELGRLQNGAVGGGKQEWEVNLDVARRTAALLSAGGIQVDVLPATVPPRYRANAFIAIHADGDPAGEARGFKVARPGFSSLPDVDDRLVQAINQTYAVETELPRDDEHISLRMRYYYAFNSRRYCHAVAPGVPQAILEMGYLTSATDRQFLIGDPGRLGRGLGDSIQNFLNTLQ
jgi:N-acetylmuramoyl-L-alanine amidase